MGDQTGKGETETKGGARGLGGIWAVDRRPSAITNSLLRCAWRDTTPSKSFLFRISPPKIMLQSVLLILYIFFFCAG
jgi:hypothetical protein